MRGTSSTLRLLLGREPGDDEEGERLLDGHIFGGFALVNYLLCMALKKPRNKKVDLFTFRHPSARDVHGSWGNSLQSPYLREIVAPAIREFLSQRP